MSVICFSLSSFWFGINLAAKESADSLPCSYFDVCFFVYLS